jgi:hypothetical protein
MKHLLIYPSLFVALAVPLALAAQNQGAAATQAADVPTYKAGGTPIAIPPPTSGLVEVGVDNHSIMEVFVPDSNRLLAAFVLSEDLPGLRSSNKALSKYALVEVPRQEEFTDLKASDFKEVADGMSKEFGAVLNSSVKESEDEVNRKIKALNLGDANVKLDHPVQLGSFFSEQDAYGCGLMMSVSLNGQSTNMIAGIILLRVRDRLIFAYLYSIYKDQESVRWVRKATEDWADAILKANQQ